MKLKKLTKEDHQITTEMKSKPNLQDAVTIASIAEILETEVSLSLRKMIAKRFLQFRPCRPHFLRNWSLNQSIFHYDCDQIDEMPYKC